MRNRKRLFLLFLLISGGWWIGCASSPKRSTETDIKNPPAKPALQSVSQPSPEKSRARSSTPAQNMQPKPNPAKPSISETTKPVSRPASVPETIQSPPPAKKDPTPNLGRKLPKLIYSEERGLYTSPSALYEIYFWDARWYVRSEGIWFRAKSYQGPWVKIDASALPEPLRR
jgi:hypothetical protein